MPNWNPSTGVLGLEWLVTTDQKSRVWGGAPGRLQRLRSTSAETITELDLSVDVNPLSHASVPTVIDVFEEGNEYVGLPKIAYLSPNADVTTTGWTRSDAATTNLYQYIDDPTTSWPAPNTNTQNQWIQTILPNTLYSCNVNAALFAAAGAAQNGRIFQVGMGAIFSDSPDGSRKLGVSLEIAGNTYEPAAGGLRDVNAYGAIYSFFWGEINPATNLPWTPADIAAFGSGGTSRLRVRSGTVANAARFPRIHALTLNVQYLETENRAAVGVWRRPEDMGTQRLQNIHTDALITMPAGTANWAKANSKNYLFFWRHSASPAVYGPVVATDVRWNGGYQDLASLGNPEGIVYPLSASGTAPSATGLCSQDEAYDVFGRPESAFTGDSRAAYAIALKRSDTAMSADSQPYRMDLVDLAFVTSSQKIGQRLVPGSSVAYVGFRCPIIPPEDVNATLTVGVYRVSDGVLMGGTYTVTSDVVRFIRNASGDRLQYYLSGFFSSQASLVSGTAYELRFTTNIGQWIMYAPDCSLAPTASFGGSTSGAFIGVTHDTNRDLCATLIQQPVAPTGVTAVVDQNDVTMPDASTREVDFVQISWTAPSTPLGSAFKRYELERLTEGQTDWVRVANLNAASLLTFPDHQAHRELDVTYRVRQVALDGRFSAWATSSTVTPQQGDYDVLLTSNHRPDLEVVFEIPDQESNYEFRQGDKKEIIPLYGSDLQVVFKEAEDRGVTWKVNIELNFGDEVPAVNSGDKSFTPLLDITLADDIPFVCAMDYQGVRFLGDVTPSGGKQKEPGSIYTASLEIVPTHSRDIPVEVNP